MENVISLKSNNNIQEVVLQYLNSKNLTSGAKYQRPVNNEKVERIVSNFNPHKVNPIKVSFRDGKYWVFDGQHTLSAIKAIHKGNDCMLCCEVHYGLTYEDEARLFAEQYDGTTKVQLNAQLKSLIEAKDPDTLNIKSAIESVGFQMSFSKGKGDNKIVALGKVRTIYKDLGSIGLVRVLTLIKEAWDGMSASLDKEILGGVYKFIKTYKNEINEDIFIKNLKKVSPLQIKRDGKCDTSVSGDLKYAKQILVAYNKNLTKKTRLDYKFKG